MPNWLSTHPEPAARVVDTQPLAAKMANASAGAIERNRDGYRDRINGIVIGDNPKDGIVRGHAFLHPALRFALEFPEGWDVMNTPTQVAAREPGQPHYMLLQMVDQARGRSSAEVAVNSMRSGGFKRLDGSVTTLNGLDAYIGLYQGSIQGIGNVIMRAAHVLHGRQAYVFAGFAPQDQFDRIDGEVSKALQTFRPLTAREADEIRPNRLDFYVVRPGDTWQSIASRGGGLVRASDLAIMNRYEVSDQPQPGDRIKIVVIG